MKKIEVDGQTYVAVESVLKMLTDAVSAELGRPVKKRGRKPGSKAAEAPVENKPVAVNEKPVYTGKKRGRKPKALVAAVADPVANGVQE